MNEEKSKLDKILKKRIKRCLQCMLHYQKSVPLIHLWLKCFDQFPHNDSSSAQAIYPNGSISTFN